MLLPVILLAFDAAILYKLAGTFLQFDVITFSGATGSAAWHHLLCFFCTHSSNDEKKKILLLLRRKRRGSYAPPNFAVLYSMLLGNSLAIEALSLFCSGLVSLWVVN